MQSHPRTLISTAWRDGPLYDYWGSNTPHTLFRLGGKRLISLGLRFIKQNVPGIEILEMPTAEEYRRALARGWDIVGISFYLDETRRALEMVAEARRAGAAEVWGGNYGVLTPEVRPHFDRIFLGYAEHEIAQALGHKLENLAHPPMVVPFGMPFWKIVRFGLLFTTRGCCFGCTFCQTPAFAPKPWASRWKASSGCSSATRTTAWSTCSSRTRTSGSFPAMPVRSASCWRGTACSGR